MLRAACDGNVKEMGRLLDGSADIDADGKANLLHVAIENDKASCVRLLIERGADIERPTQGYASALAHAVDVSIDSTIQSGGDAGDEPTDVVLLLLSTGALVEPGLRVAKSCQSARLIRLLTAASHPDLE